MDHRQLADARQWVPTLLQRYARILTHNSQLAPPLHAAFNSLQFADALLDKLTLTQSHPDHALQCVVMGPTQSGKSTLVNALLDTSAAGISALAGYTVHAQGYATGVSETDLQQIESCMAPMQRTPADQLQAKVLDAFVLEPVTAGAQALLSAGVVWDTPDFDSIEAGTYQRAVLNALALADVLILMVSKDKYGDKSVWDMLELLQPFKQALIVCINKLDGPDEAVVCKAFNDRYETRFNTRPPALISLPFMPKSDNQSLTGFPAARLDALKLALHSAESKLDRSATAPAIEQFVDTHKSQWLAPLLAERDAARQWRALTQLSISGCEERYVKDYLNNPDKYDTFNRALAELLSLLEIPGLAPTLTRTRQLVTWPARKLLDLGKSTLQSGRSRAGGASAGRQSVDEESEILNLALDGALIGLQSALLDQDPSPFWQAMNRRFRERETHIRQTFMAQSAAARAEFEPQIEAAAQSLYEQLQSQPALLNSLRAARATADAAGVALALKSGGLAPADLVLAPAMLSLTTLLTESALGRYLDTIKAQLKAQQRKHINERVFQGTLAPMLNELVEQLDASQLFAQELEPELLALLDSQQSGDGEGHGQNRQSAGNAQ